MNDTAFDGCGFAFLAVIFSVVAVLAVVAYLVLEQIR